MHRFFTDKNGKQTIVLFPNPPLWLWIAATVTGMIVKSEPYHKIIGWIGTAAIITWAILELVSGTSMFRRVLGGVVLIFALLSVVKRLL